MIHIIESDECALHKVKLVESRYPRMSMSFANGAGNEVVLHESEERLRVCPLCTGGKLYLEGDLGTT